MTTTNDDHAVSTGDAPEDSSAGAARRHGIQVFSAPSDAPRVRWKTDLISAAFVAILGLILILVAGNGSTFDDLTLEFVGGLPGWLLWLSQAAYGVGVLYSIGLLLGVGIFAKGRLGVCATWRWRPSSQS